MIASYHCDTTFARLKLTAAETGFVKTCVELQDSLSSTSNPLMPQN